MMRAALYARVSTEDQVDGYSLDAQRRAFRELVADRGWSSANEYAEEGKSAHTDDVKKRVHFQQAIGDALEGKYDVLVVHKIDRFSRKLRVTLEYFEKLGTAGVGFVSIQNNIDYSTPTGKLMLIMQGGLAEFYSDNLSEEVKKGLAERKAQGLYCGSLPFGMVKLAKDDPVPVPDPATVPALALAFELGSLGKSDREVAQALNAGGHRTTGPNGGNPFGSSSVRGILTNKFYVGFLPDGEGGWLKGKHGAVVTEEIWNQVQAARARNRTSSHTSTSSTKRIHSLTGLTYCWECKGRIHVQSTYKGEPRLGCYNRDKGWDCTNRSANLRIYEAQIAAYLSTFHIPGDYQERILAARRQLEEAYDDTEKQRDLLRVQAKRLKELYEWGDLTRADYRAKRDAVTKQLRDLEPTLGDHDHLTVLASFLADVHLAWKVATPEQRNKLAHSLFDEVWVKDKEVVAVKPRHELAGFFELNYDQWHKEFIERHGSTRVDLYRKHDLQVLLAA